jgi:hypothetical protein
MPKSTFIPSKARPTRISQPKLDRSREEVFAAAGEAPETAFESSSDHSLPPQEAIAARAFMLSEERQRTGREGDELSDWLQAEAELIAASR